MTDLRKQNGKPEQLRAPGKRPPCDLDAEGSILSACLLDPPTLDRALVEGLSPEMFYADANRLIFNAMKDLAERGAPTDAASVATVLRDRKSLERVGGTPYLAQILDAIPAVTAIENFVVRVRDKWRMRQAISTMIEKLALAHEPTEDTQGFLDDLEVRVSEIARSFEGAKGLVRFGDAAGRAFERVKAAHDLGRSPGTSYGFTHLDRKTTGLHDTDVVVVAGRPGMGKTAFAIDIALHVARGSARIERREGQDVEVVEDAQGVAIFSLEMSDEQLAARTMASRAKIDAQRMRGGMLHHAEWPRLADAVAEIEKLPVWVDDTAAVTVAEIRSRARKLKLDIERDAPGRRLGLIVVDYLQLVGSVRRGRESREELVAENMRGMKQLAKDLGVPILVLAQLNRSCETRTTKDKRPQLSDLRESGSIEQDADAVLFLYRDEYYFPDSPDRGICEVILAKQRHGPVGKIKLKFTSEHTRFDNLASEEYEFDEFDDFEQG